MALAAQSCSLRINPPMEFLKTGLGAAEVSVHVRVLAGCVAGLSVPPSLAKELCWFLWA